MLVLGLTLTLTLTLTLILTLLGAIVYDPTFVETIIPNYCSFYSLC